MNWPRVITRPATVDEIPYLAARLAEDPTYEKVDLAKSVVYVAEYNGELVGFGACYLTFRVEPLFLFPEFRTAAPSFARKRATFQLIRELDEWIADPARNLSGVRSFFCFIVNKTMRKLALAYRMLPAYTGGAFFGKRIFNRED